MKSYSKDRAEPSRRVKGVSVLLNVEIVPGTKIVDKLTKTGGAEIKSIANDGSNLASPSLTLKK